MTSTHLTPSIIRRTQALIDSSGILDIICPPRTPGEVGRIGNMRENVQLALLGIGLTTRICQETNVLSIHRVLTESVPRQAQWGLGILRPLTTKSTTRGVADPDMPTGSGKPRKRTWPERGVEQIGYDDLINAFKYMRTQLDYGLGSAPGIDDAERQARIERVQQIVDNLIVASTVPRTGSMFAIDETGQWAWSRGPAKGKRGLEKAITKAQKSQLSEEPDDVLEIADIAMDRDGLTAPAEQPASAACATNGKCLDAAWGHKTGKGGEQEAGFGFHQHTIVRVPDPGKPDSEPIVVDGFTITPANHDVVEASLNLVDRIRARMAFTVLAGDLLYTNLKAERWAVPLATRGIEQVIDMRRDNHRIFGVQGAILFHGWLHCPGAIIDTYPTAPERASKEEWLLYCATVDDFQYQWALARKESGLGTCQTSKWICQALDKRAGCHARGPVNVAAAIKEGKPVIVPPVDWESRNCCTNKTVDYTPDPTNPKHQRKLMQRFYFGGTRWRFAFRRRALVEGVFGILKNPSRQRLRRGQNRLPGLAIAHIIAAIKIAIFNEEQTREWHERTGLGPVRHPLLTPADPYYGFADLTEDEAVATDATYLAKLCLPPDLAA